MKENNQDTHSMQFLFKKLKVQSLGRTQYTYFMATKKLRQIDKFKNTVR